MFASGFDLLSNNIIRKKGEEEGEAKGKKEIEREGEIGRGEGERERERIDILPIKRDIP